ncbi:MAG: branched-chain amino acid ABC transporter substrate-binding protein [Thiothrix sp.]|nr:MAG: branched-chain amino acid ABC transporter substrate-binding protein [Thiothrix sp.]
MNNKKSILRQFIWAALCVLPCLVQADATNPDEIRLATSLDLQGQSKGLGTGMLTGLEAALKDKQVGAKHIKILSENDNYSPPKTVVAVNKLLSQDVFAFVGNVGTPTAVAALPLLAEKKVPAIGFFTGSDLLRSNQEGVINYRASYSQEVQTVVEEAFKNGYGPASICAYVQDDSYGLSGLKGLKEVLVGKQGVSFVAEALDKIFQQQGDDAERNGIGPVGFYKRNSLSVRAAYDSIKAWEAKQSRPCKFVVTVGSYESVAQFISYSQGKKESWLFSAVSFTGADNFLAELSTLGVKDRVLMTQVVPPLDSELPIVTEARADLGSKLGYVSLEGYIVGRMLLKAMNDVSAEGKELSRENVVAALKGHQFDLGGLPLDFTNDNQGSDLVVLTALADNQWAPVDSAKWKGWNK